MKRKALVVGIDHYEHIISLSGCVNDARSVAPLLERHADDGSVNFEVTLIEGATTDSRINRAILRERIKALFAETDDTALFYFAGHGYTEITGGYLCASDCRTGSDGVPLGDILVFANCSRAKNKIIVLDSCHSGVAGNHPMHADIAELSEGVTILTASTAEQYAVESDGKGVFTSLLVDALGGSAANLVGDVTPGSVYAHIDQSLGPWAQRPVFKANVEQFVSLRRVAPSIPQHELQRIAEFFPDAGYHFPLDPSYEPERSGVELSGVPPPDCEKTKQFAILQKFNRNNLIVPEGVPHMWHAAMESRTVKLTALGEHYRRLAEEGRI